MISDRILVTGFLISLGLQGWRGWAKTPGTPLPAPELFTAVLVVYIILGVVATFAAPVAAALAIAFLLYLAIQGNPLGPQGSAPPGTVSGAGSLPTPQ